MRNEHSSDGLAEELIRTFTQFGCAELHTKTLMEKSVAELNQGMVGEKDIPQQLEKIDNYRTDMENYAGMRRKTMLYLFEKFNGDKNVWCKVKHLSMAMFTAFEAFEASDNDEFLEQLWLDSNSLFIKSLSEFLGIEITDCSACFAEIIKGEEEWKDKSTS